MSLTEREELFVAAYVSEANMSATKAYVLAGYIQPGQTGNRGKQLLQRPQVQEAIAAALKEKTKGFFINEQIILFKLWEEAHKTGKESTQSGRISALVWIGKHLGMFQEKPVVTQEKTGVTYNIVNFGVDNTQVEKEVLSQKVLEHAPLTGIDVQCYSEDEILSTRFRDSQEENSPE